MSTPEREILSMYNDDREYLDFLMKNNVLISNEPFKVETRLSEKVINPNQNWHMLSQKLDEDGIVIVDNFLNVEYAHRLRNFFLFFNHREIRYKDYAALNFYKEEELSNRIWFPLLTNIVEECKESVPYIRDLKFIRAWSFIYNNESDGVGAHADPAAVNINMWVTPNECMNMKTGYNGLDIWKTYPPEDWDWNTYNNDSIAIENWIKSSNAEKIEIPYNFNRAIIFKSKMFHKSQPVSSKNGYENRRINYTFLFKEEQ